MGDDGKIVGSGDFGRQADQAFRNLDRALRAGGSSFESVAKVTIYLTDMKHFAQVVDQRRRWFSKPYPADTIVQVSGLYSPEAMIEIEAIALADEERR